MRKKLIILSASVLFVGVMLTGCGLDNVGDLGNKKIRNNQVRYDANGNLIKVKTLAEDQLDETTVINEKMKRSNNLRGSHKNVKIEMNEKIANSITSLIVDVKSSYVMLADNNAYVAVSLNESEPKGNAKLMSRSQLGKKGKEGIDISSKHMSGLSTGAEKLTNPIKEQVNAIVKKDSPKVEHVYISADPEFVVRMNAYINDVKLGNSVQGYIAEFNGMVERIFSVKSGEVTNKEAPMSHRHMQP